jgi:phage head maturation protease
MEANFAGWATRPDIKCTDGRTIKPGAFEHMDGKKVPLVWSHGHGSPDNVLGHVLLQAKDGGLRCLGFFNETPAGVAARALVEHGDINSLSIWANKLTEKAKQVFHGFVREVSLVLAGANEGAKIDSVNLQHADGESEILEDEAIIHTGLELEIIVAHAAADQETVQDVYDTLTDKQKTVVNFMIGQAISANASMAQSDEEEGVKGDDVESDETAETVEDNNEDASLTHKEGTNDVTANVFDQNASNGGPAEKKHVLSHADQQAILKLAKRPGHTLKTALEDWFESNHLAHGIESLETLFPDARNITGTPEFIKRQTEWVAGVLGGVSKTPFSRIKTLLADLTQDEARALGYIKGNLKKEEWIKVTKRTTAPTTVYKKQKLDRDDILDIIDFDVVIWIKAEMRLMLEEELARAILIGDGRDPGSDDKIKDPVGAQDGIGIRSIAYDNLLYTTVINHQFDALAPDYNALIERILLARDQMKGTGVPTFYTTYAVLTRMLLSKDSFNRRLYATKDELTSALMVKDVVAVEAMESDTALLGVLVNLQDYSVGTDRGGEVNLFDDFDIDYNRFTYLMETRMSGALTKYKAAMVVMNIDPTYTEVVPNAPTFVSSTGVVTIVATTHITYKDADTGATLSTGAQTALDPGATLNVIAVPDATYFVDDTKSSYWSFTRPHA